MGLKLHVLLLMSYIAMVITETLSIEDHRKYSTVSLNDYMDANV